jgi:hypothetical protein
MFIDSKRKQQLKLAAIIIGVIVVVASVYYAIVAFTHNDKMAVVIMTAPNDATVTLNGQDEKNGTIYLKPGDYKLKVSKDGFSTYEDTVNINHDQQVVTAELEAISDAAKKFVNDHANQFTDLEGRAGEEANRNGEAYTNENPIIAALPYDDMFYTIGYEADPADPYHKVIVTIDADAGHRNAAVQQIRDLGFNPTELKIKFRDYTNPFDHE